MNFKKDLIDNIIPFWLDNAIDKENGGIFTQLDEKGNIYGTEKSVWFQGRALWTFSKAYNLIEKNPKYLEAAKTIYEFLPKCEDNDGRMFFTVTKEGVQLQKRRYYFSETFAAIGCAEYYKACGEKKVMEDAEKYFDTAYKCYTGEIKTEPKIKNLDTKALSPVMIMLSTAQVLRSLKNENYDKYNLVCKECLDEIINGGFLTEKALLESVGKDKSFKNTPTGRIVNPGHSMECAWFIMMEGIITDNEDAINKAKEIIDITYPIGWDEKNGGIVAFCDLFGFPPVQLEHDMKLWWPQCESMIALYLAYLIFKDEKYLDMYEKTKKYCEKYFVDDKNGEWYGYLHYDNSVSTTLKGNIFKGPFHIPRLYMIMSVLEEDKSIDRYTL